MLKGYGEDLTRQSMIEVLLELMSYKVCLTQRYVLDYKLCSFILINLLYITNKCYV